MAGGDGERRAAARAVTERPTSASCHRRERHLPVVARARHPRTCARSPSSRAGCGESARLNWHNVLASGRPCRSSSWWRAASSSPIPGPTPWSSASREARPTARARGPAAPWRGPRGGAVALRPRPGLGAGRGRGARVAEPEREGAGRPGRTVGLSIDTSTGAAGPTRDAAHGRSRDRRDAEARGLRGDARGAQGHRWLRFIHTGEAFGVAGQTAPASRASAASAVVTGVALASGASPLAATARGAFMNTKIPSAAVVGFLGRPSTPYLERRTPWSGAPRRSGTCPSTTRSARLH